MRRNSSAALCRFRPLVGSLLLFISFTSIALAQETGTVTGTVTRAAEGAALSSVSVTVEGTGQSTVTGADGKYTLRRVPAGPQRIVFRWLGYRPTQVDVTVEAGRHRDGRRRPRGGDHRARRDRGRRARRARPSGSSRRPRRSRWCRPRCSRASRSPARRRWRCRRCPAWTSSRAASTTSTSTRGASTPRSTAAMLVLQDGRDLAIAFLGLAGVERHDPAARGPGQGGDGARARARRCTAPTPSAAWSTSPRRRPARSLGTKLTLAGGELETFRGDLRHAERLRRRPVRLPRQRRATTGATPTRRTRTRLDGTSLQREYADATDEPVGSPARCRPLNGQTVDPATGDAVGDRDPLVNGYGSGRLDYYLNNGSVLSVDGGAVAGPERDLRDRHRPGAGDQGDQALRPGGDGGRPVQRVRLLEQPDLARAAVLAPVGPAARGAERHLPRRGPEQLELPCGSAAAWSYGASLRNTRVNTSGTLMNLANDDRSDDLYSVYGQVEYKLMPAAPGGRRAPVGRRRPVRPPVLAQGRAGLQPQREPLVPVLGQPRVPDAQLLRVLPAGAGGGAVRRARRRSRAASRTTTPQCSSQPARRRARRAHHHRRPARGTSRPQTPGARAGQRRTSRSRR